MSKAFEKRVPQAVTAYKTAGGSIFSTKEEAVSTALGDLIEDNQRKQGLHRSEIDAVIELIMAEREAVMDILGYLTPVIDDAEIPPFEMMTGPIPKSFKD